jgi:hypothetical protein
MANSTKEIIGFSSQIGPCIDASAPSLVVS